MRSPAEVISHTVPSASTRPNRCGSLDGPRRQGAAARRAGPRTGPRAGSGHGGEGAGPTPRLRRIWVDVGSCVTSLVSLDRHDLRAWHSYPPRGGTPRTCRATRRLTACPFAPLFKQVADAVRADAFAYALIRRGRRLRLTAWPRRTSPPCSPWAPPFHRDRRRDPPAVRARGHRRAGRPRSTLFLRLLRDRQWWLGSRRGRRRLRAAGRGAGSGLGAAGAGAAGDVAAVRAADPRAYQPHRRVTRWEWMWAAAARAAVAVIVTVGNPTAGHSRASLETWTAGGRGPRARAGAVRGRRANVVRGPASAVLLAVVSGSLWGRVRGADQGRRGPARRRDLGRCCAHRSCTRGRWWRSRAPRGSSRRSGPGR